VFRGVNLSRWTRADELLDGESVFEGRPHCNRRGYGIRDELSPIFAAAFERVAVSPRTRRTSGHRAK
jgi:hypothetical protein